MLTFVCPGCNRHSGGTSFPLLKVVPVSVDQLNGFSIAKPAGSSRRKSRPQAGQWYSATFCAPGINTCLPVGENSSQRGHSKALNKCGFNGMRCVLPMAQFTRCNFQNEKMPVIIQLKFGRASLKKRSTRKMLTKNEPIMAQIAPMDWYDGMSR